MSEEQTQPTTKNEIKPPEYTPVPIEVDQGDIAGMVNLLGKAIPALMGVVQALGQGGDVLYNKYLKDKQPKEEPCDKQS